jgi:hypothetical protein
MDRIEQAQFNGQVGGTCETGNETSDFIILREFLDWPKTDLLLKTNFAPWCEYITCEYSFVS